MFGVTGTRALCQISSKYAALIGWNKLSPTALVKMLRYVH
jgi:hypothetical protein